MIPKIIHQTYKTTQLPDDLYHWHRRVIQLHPDWQVILWTDEDNLALVNQYFPHLLESYNALQYNIMRVDIIRYMYMAVYGGCYLDLDYELFQPLDDIIADTELLLPLSRENQGNDFYSKEVIIGNCIFASAAGHPFWKDVLDDFGKNPPIKKFYNKIDILKLTGPEFITDIYYRAPEKYQGSLVKKEVFHPDLSIAKKKYYQDFLTQHGSRGIHHCRESWLKDSNSLGNLLSRAKASAERRFTVLFR
jgi:mannosyltransferase OCH1-like enzyme